MFSEIPVSGLHRQLNTTPFKLAACAENYIDCVAMNKAD
jgi:hypothetical protein